MFCIAAFIVLAVISIFSASNRKLAKKAWSCTLHRITFRPCDTTFKEEMKAKMLSRVANRKPKLVKLADIGIEVGSFVLVILTVWSILIVLESGLNLFVWGTCNPNQASSCSLTAETCSIDKGQKGFWELAAEGKPYQWFIDKANSLVETFANIPNRIKHWEATDYLPANASYYFAKDNSKQTVLEISDPGCIVCSNLFKNIKKSNLTEKANFTYIAYPIPDVNNPGKYKFKNSYTIVRYLEAIKLNQISNLKTPADWQIMERIYTWKNSDGSYYQSVINSLLNSDETIALISGWLKDIGYSESQINQIKTDADSQKVADIIKANKKIVDEDINTVKIPTIIMNGHRYDGILGTDKLTL